MSEFDDTSEFPNLDVIIQWSQDSKHGYCCGIFGCTAKIAIRCKVCNGGYCNEHKDWHFHGANSTGVIEKNE